MKRFVSKYLDPNIKMKILEVGSLDTSNPNKKLIFRRYFDNKNWDFIGLDLIAGNNVDVVSKDKYNYPFDDNSFDLVISGNTLEHVEDMYLWIKEIARLTNNLVCIIVPNTRPYHNYPIDCWRVFPDGMKFLLKDIAKLEIIECKMSGGKNKLDTIGVAKKI